MLLYGVPKFHLASARS